MYKRTRWIISAFMVGGLLLTGTAMATQNASPPPAHATLTAQVVSPVNLDSCPTLVERDHGSCVSELQTELNTYDGAGLPVTRTFGLLTQRALIKFQQETGVIPAQGVVGPHTKATLDQTARRLAPHKKDPGGIYDNIPTRSPGADKGTSADPRPPLSDVVHCGIVTCTTYFSRGATKAMDSAAQAHLNATIGVGTAGAAGVCALASAPLGGVAATVAGTVCGIIAAEDIGSYFDQLHNAAQAGQCFAVRTAGDPESPQYALYGPHYLVRSNGYCHD